MAGMVYSHNRQSARHITCSLLYVSSSMWFSGVFITLVMYPKYFDVITIYWVNGGITLASLISLHLWLLNANMYKKKRGKWFKLLFVPGIIMLATMPLDSWMLKGDLNSLEPIFIPGTGLYLLWIVDFAYLGIALFLTVIEMKKGNKAANLWFKGILAFFIWTIVMLTGAILFQSTRFYFIFYFIPHGSLFWAIAIFLSMSRFDYLASYETRYNILFQRSPSGILIMDEDAIVLEASPQISEYLGVNREELVKTSLLSYLSGVDKESFIARHREAFKEQTKLENYEMSFVNKLLEPKTLLIDSDFIDIEGTTLQFVMVKDITEAKSKEARVQYLAYHDILTGLSNRAAFEKKITELLDTEEMFNLLLLDLNKLKQINDLYGHQAGDHAIQHIATILIKAVDGNGDHHAARLGGDEFVLLLAVNETEKVIEKIQKEISSPLLLSNSVEIFLSASIGVSCYPVDGVTLNQLYSIADKRMYAEKHGAN